MKVKYEQMIYVFIAAVIMAGAIFFVSSAIALTAVSASFVMIIGAFLSIDLAKMVKDTSGLPAGDFKPMKKCQYILSVILMTALCIEAFIISNKTGRSLDSIYGSLGVGLMIIIGMLVGGIEANKIATGKKV